VQGPNAESIFQALFTLLAGSPTDTPPFSKGVAGTDWSGNPIPLTYATRNWQPPANAVQGQMPGLYQLDPFKPERDVRTGRGRRRRTLRALIDLYFNLNTGTSDAQPWNTIFNNWQQALYNRMSPLDDPGFTIGLPTTVEDFGPIMFDYFYGLRNGTVGLVQCIVEIEVGG